MKTEQTYTPISDDPYAYDPVIDSTDRGTIARVFIQCKDEKGNLGDFLKTNGNRQVSPTFKDLQGLFEWAKQNGWKGQSGTDAYIYTGISN